MSKASAPAKTGATVTVACKLPHGLAMRVFEMIETNEPVMGGGSRTVKVAQQVGEERRLNGCAVPFGQMPNYRIVGGYALTEGVPKDFWELYEEQNKDAPFIKNNLVFAYDKFALAEGAAEEHSDTKSGLQPIQLDSKGQVSDPRAGKKIETAEDQIKNIAQVKQRNEAGATAEA